MTVVLHLETVGGRGVPNCTKDQFLHNVALKHKNEEKSWSPSLTSCLCRFVDAATPRKVLLGCWWTSFWRPLEGFIAPTLTHSVFGRHACHGACWETKSRDDGSCSRKVSLTWLDLVWNTPTVIKCNVFLCHVWMYYNIRKHFTRPVERFKI